MARELDWRLIVLVTLSAAVALFIADRGRGQSSPGRPEFEVASVKASIPTGASVNKTALEIGPARVRATHVTLWECVRLAYENAYFQIRAPGWVRSERFDIDAIAAKPTSKSELLAMFRSLLADRFRLAAHPETQNILAYALVVGKKPLLEQPGPDEVMGWSEAGGTLAFKYTTMQGFVDFLNSTVFFHLDLPVVDSTGFSGPQDFTLSYPLSEFWADRDGMLIFTAIRRLGLDLSRRRVLVKVLVVDHVERPSEN